MIDFLKDVGIKKETIEKLNNKYNKSDLFDLSCNKDNCLKIINYFKEINIKNIDELLIYELDIFTLTFNEIIKKLSHFNIPLLVSSINDDPFVIEEIYNV